MAKDRDNSLVGKDLREHDLRGADLRGKVLFGAQLQGAKLYGAQIDLACDLFDGVGLDSEQVSMLLLMLSLADIDPRFKQGLSDLVTEVVGESNAAAYRRYLKVA